MGPYSSGSSRLSRPPSRTVVDPLEIPAEYREL